MKNICFVTNYKKTYFFNELAIRLKKNGVKVCWIVLNKKLYDYLSPQYGEENLLLINKDQGNVFNEKLDEYKLNELVISDRALKYYGDWGYDYLRNIQKPIYEFIKKNNISFIFGETTYAHEVLIHRIARSRKELNCTYLHPQTIRIPGYHFTFLKDEFQSEIYEEFTFDIYSEGDLIEVQRPTESVLVEKMVKKSMGIPSKLKRGVRFFTLENLERDDPSISPTNLKGRLRKGFREEWNRVAYPFVKKTPYSQIEGKKFVLFTLHKQPEASVDIVGRYFEDQFKVIQNIWKILPDDHYLVVKEHTNAIGDRSLSFFKKLKQHRNIILADETINSHRLIQQCRAVFSISGSVAYEAALYGKPAFLFAHIFFDRLRNCHRVTFDTFRRIKNFDELLLEWEQGKQSKMSVEDFSKYLLTHSAKGLISDPLTDPKCMEEENIELVVAAFQKLIE